MNLATPVTVSSMSPHGGKSSNIEAAADEVSILVFTTVTGAFP